MGGAGFDLDETKDAFVPADQVYFPMAARRAKVAGHDNVSQAAEVEVGVFLAAACGTKVGWSCFGRRYFVAKPIEAADNGMGQFAGHTGILGG